MLTARLKSHVKRQLVKDRARLRAELDHKPEGFADEHPGYGNHMADNATEVFEQAKNLALRQNLERELEMIELALEKLAKGTFGPCENCGQLIEPARLEALPQAMFCLPCQKRLEELHEHTHSGRTG